MTFPNPAERAGWFSQQYEAWLPDDADERVTYLAQLAHEAEHGPGAEHGDPT